MSDLQAAAKRLENRLRGGAATVLQWEQDPELLKYARSLVPLTELISDDSTTYARSDDYKYVHRYDTDVLLLKRMALWFKQDFMEWINQPKCRVCTSGIGNGTNQSDNVIAKGIVAPETIEEQQGGAGRVELYQCNRCGSNLRFPRYNNVSKLIETRKGRCGEFANLFGFFCRAVGFETRYVLDFTDHVWTEVWSRRFGRWIMADSCEGKIDEPCMYEKGWGKKLNAIFGFSLDSCSEITKRYTRTFSNTDFQQRRADCFGILFDDIDEFSSYLSSAVSYLDYSLRQHAKPSAARVADLDRRKTSEKKYFQRNQTETWEDDGLSEGRISGSLAWKLSRGEVGDLKKLKGHGEGIINHAQSDKVVADPFLLSRSPRTLDIKITPSASIFISEESISINGIPFASGEIGVNVVVIDENQGCVLQRGIFKTWVSLSNFVDHIPDNRIVLLCTTGDFKAAINESLPALKRFNGFAMDQTPIGYACQISSDWYKLDKYELNFSLTLNSLSNNVLQLETFSDAIPTTISSRISETIMPMGTQVLASEKEKELAAIAAMKDTEYIGYCSKPGLPIYLLTSCCFPLHFESRSGWITKHLLPKNLIEHSKKDENDMNFSYPSDIDYFIDLLGPSLTTNESSTNSIIRTSNAVLNKRLIALYFSAHWCPPCKMFTPVLAQFYEDHKDDDPNDLEIIFVSSDRDNITFSSYYKSMPWLAIPFDDRNKKDSISRRFGIRGIPSLVVLDSISGHIISQTHAREEVSKCLGDTKSVITAWLNKLPPVSIDMIQSIEESLRIDQEEALKEIEPSSQGKHLYRQQASPALDDEVNVDPSIRIKQICQQLVEKGNNPNTAAAEALQIYYSEDVALEETKSSGSNPQTVVEGVLSTSKNDPFDSFLLINSKDSLSQLLKIVKKYIGNCQREPFNSKFRTVKVDNKILSAIVSMPQGLKLMTTLGFGLYSTSDNFFVTIPLATDLEKMSEMAKEAEERVIR